jgi:YhcH/YjgK/YiaL family protein
VIHGSLKDAEAAMLTDRRLEPGFEYLRGMASALPDGKHEIGGGARAIVSTYQTASPGEKRFEAHRRYIDLQYVAQGEEAIHVAPVSTLKTAVEYDGTGDAIFFQDPASYETITLRAGSFAVFYPEDAHRPGMTSGGGQNAVRKIVVKIPVGT